MLALLLSLLHQNAEILCSINLQRDRGSLKIDMAYCGKACTTDLSRISFPLFESNLSFQHSNLALTLPNIQENISHFDRPQSEGIPKYLLYRCNTGILNSLAKFSWRLKGQCLLKNNPDLFLFMTCLIATQY